MGGDYLRVEDCKYKHEDKWAEDVAGLDGDGCRRL